MMASILNYFKMLSIVFYFLVALKKDNLNFAQEYFYTHTNICVYMFKNICINIIYDMDLNSFL